jgi:hypothetical protein
LFDGLRKKQRNKKTGKKLRGGPRKRETSSDQLNDTNDERFRNGRAGIKKKRAERML